MKYLTVFPLLLGIVMVFWYLVKQWETSQALRTVFHSIWAAELKLKRTKCGFFKCEMYYLCHVISRKGICSLLEKLQSIRKMSSTKNTEVVRQMLGFTWYIENLSCLCWFKHLMQLTCKTAPFTWIDQCQNALWTLKMLRRALLWYIQIQIILYILCTDATKYAWPTVLIQEHCY